MIEGPTLADRIKQGPIPVDEALPIAKQIAEALEAAHEQGVIHRDLKPANIKVREDGTVKVLDFGLAKAMEGSGGDVSESPTVTAAATASGVILGTAAYMSPEQARGKPVDKRADIWSFGTVLFEMLTGRRPFEGRDVSEVLGGVLRLEPKWNALPSNTPPHLAAFLKQCLQKEPKQRARDIGDVRLALEGGFNATPGATVELTSVPRPQVWQRPFPATLWSLAVFAIGGFAVWGFLRSGTQPSQEPTRLVVTLPDGQLMGGGGAQHVALSPDGQTLVYSATRDASRQLFVRPINRFEATPLTGTEESGRGPFLSPDGQWIGHQKDGELRKVTLAGDVTQTITALPVGYRGADWGADDVITYGAGNVLMQVPAAGGNATSVFTSDERQVRHPQALAGGDAVLVSLYAGGVPDTAENKWELHLVRPTTGEHRMLLSNANMGRVLDTGHLVFIRGGALWGVRFDESRLDIVGEPVPVVEGVRVTAGGGDASYAVGNDGSLAYVPGDSGSTSGRRLAWVDREGRATPLNVPPVELRNLDLSPDGSRAAVGVFGDTGNVDVWVAELTRGTLTRLTTDPASDEAPLWHPDGRRVVFGSLRKGEPELFWRESDGSGAANLLLSIEETVTELRPSGWSPDGATLLVEATLEVPRWQPRRCWAVFGDTGNVDVWVAELTRGTLTRSPTTDPASDEAPLWHPDGRRVVFGSLRKGEPELFWRESDGSGAANLLLSTKKR